MPDDWDIKIKVQPIFGGFSDTHRIHPQNTDDELKSELIIKGMVIFGGGEIKSY